MIRQIGLFSKCQSDSHELEMIWETNKSNQNSKLILKIFN